MHDIFVRQCCVMALMALVGMFSVSPVEAAANVAAFKKVHGSVDVFHGGGRTAVPVQVGAGVRVGDVVRTGRRSRAQLKFADGSVLNIGSLAKIEIGEFTYDAEKKIRRSSIRNLRGKVRAAVSKVKTEGSYFRVKTPGAVAAVRGTNFVVDVVSPTVTVVVTFEGAVAVSSLRGSTQGAMVMVRANQFTRVVVNHAPTAPAAAPPAVLKNMATGTKQVKAADTTGAAVASAGTTTTTTTGSTTATGATTTTTTTTVTDTGTTTVSTTSDAGVPLASPGSVATVAAPVVVAPVVNIPPPVTPPITTVVPAIKKANVNIVIVF